ncbi:MAG: polysaccharide biosynthesis tyrosine autokinase, partial [Bacteroidota bacterium]
LIYTTFIMFGLVLGLAIMFFRYLTFNEINMIDDLQRLLPDKATILGGVPMHKSEMEFSQLVVGESPKSMMAESLRKIRTNLSYINPNYKTIAISSSVSGEGKTFVALNLAGIIALSGKRTILLDLDLRKPKIHLGLNADNTKGMSGLIVGQYELEDCIQHSTLENLDFITAGPVPPNPSELLLSDNFVKLVEELKRSYQVIVIDNPPIGLVSDGIKNLTEADIPIYVFKSHYSKRVFAHRLRELFEMQKLERLNVILNGLRVTRFSSYGYGHYGYGYGYYEGLNPSLRERLAMRIKNTFLRLIRRGK